MDQHLTITSPLEAMSLGLERRSQFRRVVNFPVDHGNDVSPLRNKGLLPPGQINNAQTPHPQDNSSTTPPPLPVRPPVLQTVQGTGQPFFGGNPSAFLPQDAGDSTHNYERNTFRNFSITRTGENSPTNEQSMLSPF